MKKLNLTKLFMIVVILSLFTILSAQTGQRVTTDLEAIFQGLENQQTPATPQTPTTPQPTPALTPAQRQSLTQSVGRAVNRAIASLPKNSTVAITQITVPNQATRNILVDRLEDIILESGFGLIDIGSSETVGGVTIQRTFGLIDVGGDSDPETTTTTLQAVRPPTPNFQVTAEVQDQGNQQLTIRLRVVNTTTGQVVSTVTENVR